MLTYWNTTGTEGPSGQGISLPTRTRHRHPPADRPTPKHCTLQHPRGDRIRNIRHIIILCLAVQYAITCNSGKCFPRTGEAARRRLVLRRGNNELKVEKEKKSRRLTRYFDFSDLIFHKIAFDSTLKFL